MIEDLPGGLYPDRPWDVGNNPKTAVNTFLTHHPEFVVGEYIANLLTTVAPGSLSAPGELMLNPIASTLKTDTAVVKTRRH